MNVREFFIILRNLIIGINLISLRFLLNPRKLVGIITTQLFFYSTLSEKRKLKQKNPQEIITSQQKFEIKINTNNKEFWGNNPSYTKDILTLCILTKLVKAERIFEIGTYKGYTAMHFAMNTSLNSKIFTLDLPSNFNNLLLKSTILDRSVINKSLSEKNYCFSGTANEKKINCLFGDSHSFDFTDFHNNIDLFFIDGAHSYEYVKSDTLNAIKCVKKGGFIFWHDYGRWGVNGVSKWLHKFASQGKEVYSVPGSSLAWMIVE